MEDTEPTQQPWSGAGKITRLTAWALSDIWVSCFLGNANYSHGKSDFTALGFYRLLSGRHFHVTSRDHGGPASSCAPGGREAVPGKLSFFTHSWGRALCLGCLPPPMTALRTDPTVPDCAVLRGKQWCLLPRLRSQCLPPVKQNIEEHCPQF